MPQCVFEGRAEVLAFADELLDPGIDGGLLKWQVRQPGHHDNR